MNISRFQWVALQLTELRKCSSFAAMKRQLATLPKGLNGAYDRILESVHPSDCDEVKVFLQWLAFSTRPLSPEELAGAVLVDFSTPNWPIYAPEHQYIEPRAVLNKCSGLVVEAEGQGSPMRHYSH